MSDRIARSVAFTREVDEALAALAASEGTSRAGRVTVHPVDAVVPNGYAGNYARAAEVDQIVRDLVVLGGIKHEHRRGGRRWIQPAPWATNEDQ